MSVLRDVMGVKDIPIEIALDSKKIEGFADKISKQFVGKAFKALADLPPEYSLFFQKLANYAINHAGDDTGSVVREVRSTPPLSVEKDTQTTPVKENVSHAKANGNNKKNRKKGKAPPAKSQPAPEPSEETPKVQSYSEVVANSEMEELPEGSWAEPVTAPIPVEVPTHVIRPAIVRDSSAIIIPTMTADMAHRLMSKHPSSDEATNDMITRRIDQYGLHGDCELCRYLAYKGILYGRSARDTRNVVAWHLALHLDVDPDVAIKQSGWAVGETFDQLTYSRVVKDFLTRRNNQ